MNRNAREGVEFRYLSKDGEEGYPGTVEARVWYTAGIEEGKTVLEVEYEAELVGDECEETVVGMTNHRSDILSFHHPTPLLTTSNPNKFNAISATSTSTSPPLPSPVQSPP